MQTNTSFEQMTFGQNILCAYLSSYHYALSPIRIYILYYHINYIWNIFVCRCEWGKYTFKWLLFLNIFSKKKKRNGRIIIQGSVEIFYPHDE